jgi:hypothetical protein
MICLRILKAVVALRCCASSPLTLVRSRRLATRSRRLDLARIGPPPAKAGGVGSRSYRHMNAIVHSQV